MLTFALVQHHGYSMIELDNMIPFERDIFKNLLENHLEKQRQEIEQSGYGK